MLLSLVILFLLGVSKTLSIRCGVGDPLYEKILDVPPTIVPQQYLSDSEVVSNYRRLQQNQQYDDDDSFIPIDEVHEAGGTQPIRIVALWDVIHDGDPTNPGHSPASRYQCVTADPANPQHNILAAGLSGSYALFDGCSEEHLVAVDSERYDVMRGRTSASIDYWQKTLWVKPVQDPIVINIASSNGLAALNGRSVPDADLVMIMTARPSPSSPIAGYAMCLQYDQRGRCTVGQFNWVPEVLNVERSWSLDVIETELQTGMHEIMHILGGMQPIMFTSRSVFLNPDGSFNYNTFAVEEDPAYSDRTGSLAPVNGFRKARTVVNTPKVLNFTRTHFDCPTATGFPLEDTPLGKGSHWEARVAGPELMSYGTLSGQVYVSDMTLGYLEDTGQYIANYTMAGPIIKVGDSEYAEMIRNATSHTETGDGDGSDVYQPPDPPPLGAPTWGYKAGCDFLNGNPKEKWPKEYLCNKHLEYACTPDNRMSSVCIVRGDYHSSKLPVESNPTCGRLATHPVYTTQYVAQCDTTNDAGGQIPSYMRYFATDDEASQAADEPATAATTGGYNNAMDYLPLQVGYWNCMYSNPSDGAVRTQGDMSMDDISQFFGSEDDMDTYGGQTHCPDCRCFPSSLVEAFKFGSNGALKVYGLCYRANCYREDYLQVGIRSQFNRRPQWYKCPTEGGKMYIPGYLGSIHCPPSVDFCSKETVTGYKFKETNVVLEAIFWGVIVGLGLILLFFLLCPCIRESFIRCTKTCCGARTFPYYTPRYLNNGELEPPPPLPKVASRILLTVNIITFLIAIAIIGLAIYALKVSRLWTIGVNSLGVGVVMFIISFSGLASARKRAEIGPSCWLLTYFMGTIIILVLLTWVLVWTFAFESWKEYIEENWDTLHDAITRSNIRPEIFQDPDISRTDLIAEAISMVEEKTAAIGGLIGGALGLYFLAFLAAAFVMKGRTLASITTTFLNNTFLCFGLLMITVGIYVASFGGSSVADLMKVIGLVIGTGCLAVVMTAIGHIGVFKKNLVALGIFFFLLCLSIALSITTTYICFANTDFVQRWIDEQDDDALAKVASAFGYSMDGNTIGLRIMDNLRQLGLAFGVILFLLIILLISSIVYAIAVYNQKRGREQKKGKVRIVMSKFTGRPNGDRIFTRRNGPFQDGPGPAAHPPILQPTVAMSNSPFGY